MRVGGCGVRCVNFIPPETLPRRSLKQPGQATLVLGSCWKFLHTYSCLRSPHKLIRRYRRHQDCRGVEDLVARTFSPLDGPSGLIIYVGQRPEYVTFSLPPFVDPDQSGKRKEGGV
jgi:hypothetical protein